MASMRPPRYCKACDSKTHNESECWGECQHCGQREQQSSHCRYRKTQEQKKSTSQTGRADKAAPKGKKKRNRKAGERAAITNTDSRRESEDEDEEISEEESPIKPDSDGTYRSRTVRLNYRDLNEQLSNMQEDERRILGKKLQHSELN